LLPQVHNYKLVIYCAKIGILGYTPYVAAASQRWADNGSTTAVVAACQPRVDKVATLQSLTKNRRRNKSTNQMMMMMMMMMNGFFAIAAAALHDQIRAAIAADFWLLLHD